MHFYSCRTFSCLTRGESDYGRNPFSQPSYLSCSLSYSYIPLYFSLIFPFPQYFNISLSLSQLSLPHCSLIRQHSLSLSCDIVLLLTSGLCGSQMYYSMMWPIIEIQITVYFPDTFTFWTFTRNKPKPGCHMTVNLYGSTLHNKRSHSQIFLQTLFFQLSTLPDSFHRSTVCTLLCCLQMLLPCSNCSTWST